MVDELVEVVDGVEPGQGRAMNISPICMVCLEDWNGGTRDHVREAGGGSHNREERRKSEGPNRRHHLEMSRKELRLSSEV